MLVWTCLETKKEKERGKKKEKKKEIGNVTKKI